MFLPEGVKAVLGVVVLVLLGVVIVMGYFVLTLMMFNSPKPVELVIVGVLAGLCVALGVVALIRHCKPPAA